MSLENFAERAPENSPGRLYVTSACTDCDLCRDTAPKFFRRQDEGGYSYVHRQPRTAEDWKLAEECMEGCPMQAIHSDGNLFDWDFGHRL